MPNARIHSTDASLEGEIIQLPNSHLPYPCFVNTDVETVDRHITALLIFGHEVGTYSILIRRRSLIYRAEQRAASACQLVRLSRLSTTALLTTQYFYYALRWQK